MRNSTLYKIAGPRTLRLASKQILPKKIVFNGKTVRKGWGSNLQNIEKSMRQIYWADDNKIFVQVDQSGAEAMIVAYCCENGNYRQLFINRIKPHTYLGAHLFKHIWPTKMREHHIISGDTQFDIDEILNTPIPQLRQHPFWNDLAALIQDSDNWSTATRYYFLSKQTEHSSNFDVGAPMFRMNTLEKSGGKVVISKEDAEHFLLTKFSLFPEIKGYHRWLIHNAETNKMLFNLHGHPYNITAYEIQPHQRKELYSWIPQSTVGEITTIAYVRMQAYIEEQALDWDLLANTHDSYLLQCPLSEELDCAKKAKEFMEQEFTSPIDGVVFRMRSEAQSGMNWRPWKKEVNELGLKEIKGL